MPSAFGSSSGDWTLLDEGGSTAVSFTTFEDLDVKSDGSALQYPVEEGSFASYNKVTDPLSIKLTLSVQGDDSDFDAVLSQLDDYKTDAVVLTVATPAVAYDSMTLESYSYKRARKAGAGMLTVELDLVEVREVTAQTTTVTTTASSSSSAKSSSANTSSTASAKNPTSTDTKDSGKTQTKEPMRSLMAGGSGYLGGGGD